MTKTAAEMTALEVLADRKWGASITVEQARSQIAHEQAGCPVPFPGAVWNGYCYVGKRG